MKNILQPGKKNGATDSVRLSNGGIVEKSMGGRKDHWNQVLGHCRTSWNWQIDV